MPMDIFNLDTQQAHALSKYPFDDASTMQVYNYIFKSSWIPSIGVAVESATFPLFIGRFTHMTVDACRMSILDSSNKQVAYAVLTRSATSVQSESSVVAGNLVAPLKDTYDLRCGQIMYNPEFSGFILNVLTTQHLQELEIAATALILSPECITCTHTTGCKRIVFNGQYKFNRSVNIVFQRNTILTTCDETDELSDHPSINVYGNKAQTEVQQITYTKPVYLQTINGLDLRNYHILIKPKVLSDVRVITTAGVITFAGVRDAQ